VYKGRLDEAEAAVPSMRIDGDRTRAKRRLGTHSDRAEAAGTGACDGTADRGRSGQRLALDCRAIGDGRIQRAFFELVIPATRFPNAIPAILAYLLRIRPALVLEMERPLEEFVPGLASGERCP